MGRKFVLKIILPLLFWVLISARISTASAYPPWSYDFESPSSLDSWTMAFGNFSADGGSLSLKDCVQITGSCSGSIWRDTNNETTGVWELDYYQGNTDVSFGLIFYFVGIDVTEGDFETAGWYPRYAYGLFLRTDGSMQLFYQPDAISLLPVWLANYNNVDDPIGWFHLSIQRNSDGLMQVYKNSSLILEATDGNLTASEYNNIQMEQGVKVDNLEYHDPNYVDPVTDTGPGTDESHLTGPEEGILKSILSLKPSWYILMPIALITVSIGGYGYRTIRKRRMKRLSLSESNNAMIDQYGSEFDLSDSSISVLIGGLHRIDEKYQDPEFSKQIPAELLNYRYLMHPIRLTIMKLLYHENKMRSVEIKHALNISWGDFSNHIKSLQDKGFVEIVDEFNEDGHVSQAVYILERGRHEFFDLFQLLKQFAAVDSPIQEMMSNDQSDNDKLYPK